MDPTNNQPGAGMSAADGNAPGAAPGMPPAGSTDPGMGAAPAGPAMSQEPTPGEAMASQPPEASVPMPEAPATPEVPAEPAAPAAGAADSAGAAAPAPEDPSAGTPMANSTL